MNLPKPSYVSPVCALSRRTTRLFGALSALMPGYGGSTRLTVGVSLHGPSYGRPPKATVFASLDKRGAQPGYGSYGPTLVVRT